MLFVLGVIYGAFFDHKEGTHIGPESTGDAARCVQFAAAETFGRVLQPAYHVSWLDLFHF